MTEGKTTQGGDQAVWKAESENIELLHVMIGEMLDQQALAYPDREALVYHYPELGLPLPHTEAKIVDPQTGEPVGFGEPGELLMRGFLVMKGYYQMPEKAAEAIDAQGWLHSGDLATMNAQGYLNIVGRLKDMVIRGGENLYPAEIEQFLMRHPKIADAQVVGVPDPYMVEEMVALLKLKPGESASEEEIRAYCQGAISRHKIPRYIRFVMEYPLTTSGKVKKFEMRAQMIETLGLQEGTKTQMA